ncbi:hypothetical protein N5D61_03450 [Pseudomonas sp. GD03842]|uniref:hypothetical protein n=1 Tax=unclassified Pseudomonas TaxID=196821 RepID=UPI0011BF9A31|nr:MULTISPECIES: hypothetical protein [unclassified Pseudomonas]MDH0745401.1 hypothetical protein [Pseudomonas sp. GD03842]
MNHTSLASPTIPVADHDGLIPVASLSQDIEVHVPVWSYSNPGDTFQLLLNGQLTGATQQLPSPIPPIGTELRITLNRQALAEDGLYEVSYRATNVLGGISADSPPRQIRIDRTSPGGALLAPMIFPGATFGHHLIGLLPGYAGMEPGDTIQTLCNGVPGPQHVVQPDELTLRPIEIVFDREALKDLGTDNVSMSYTVTDRAGNESISSMALVMSLTL